MQAQFTGRAGDEGSCHRPDAFLLDAVSVTNTMSWNIRYLKFTLESNVRLAPMSIFYVFCRIQCLFGNQDWQIVLALQTKNPTPKERSRMGQEGAKLN